MTDNPVASERGLALILVISFVSALVVAGITMNRQARGMLASSAAESHRLALHEACRSGAEAAVALLETGSEEEILAWLLSEEERAAFSEEINRALAVANASIEVLITDERARIQVNALAAPPHWQQFDPDQRQLWERFLRILKAAYGDEIEFSETEIIDALKDWLDAGDDDAVTGLSGAENDYYEGLPVPYAAANAPIRDVGELLLVKGMPTALYYGPGGMPGLAQYVTAYGADGERTATPRFDGKININTAAPPVIAALLPVEYQSLGESIISFRDERILAKDYQVLKQPAWYKNAPGCADIDLPPKLTTAATNLFRITVRASDGARDHRLTAGVECRRADGATRQRCEIAWLD